MNDATLEVTYQDGQPYAAYYHLPRELGVKSHGCKKFGDYMVADFSGDGTPLGIEIIHPTLFKLEEFNAVLRELGWPLASESELAPLRAA